MVESLLSIGAGAGGGEKNTWSRSKTDRLYNTAGNLKRRKLSFANVNVSFAKFV